MFWKIIFFLTALQIAHVISYCDSQNSNTCAVVYSQLENLCYDFTGKAGDYFSVQDIHQRDGFFAVREASIYVAYNACGKITRSIDNYRTGQDLEKNKVTPGSSNNPSQSGGSSQTPPNSSSPTSSSPTPPPASGTGSTPPPSGSGSTPPPTSGGSTPPPTGGASPSPPTGTSPTPSQTPSPP